LIRSPGEREKVRCATQIFNLTQGESQKKNNVVLGREERKRVAIKVVAKRIEGRRSPRSDSIFSDQKRKEGGKRLRGSARWIRPQDPKRKSFEKAGSLFKNKGAQLSRLRGKGGGRWPSVIWTAQLRNG